MADPKAPELPEGWTRDTERNAARFKSEHRAVDVELTHEELCVGTQENFRGSYDNTSAFIPLPLLLEMLAAFEFHMVSEADKRVLEAMAALPDPLLEGMATWPHFAEPIKAELARRATLSARAPDRRRE